jgi:HAD superfamily hydrolase (TIGR01490 family)
MMIAFFDFDGTITTDDSLIKFIRYAVGDFKFAWGMLILSPMLITYKLKLLPNYKAKQWMLSYFFKGMDEQMFKNLAEEFSLSHIDNMLRPKAMGKIAWHKDRGHKVVVVSASMECWLKPWCDKNGLDIIATKLEIKNSTVTGKLQTKNCYGSEKLVRVKEAYNLDDCDHIYVYGDSRGDRELLNLAHTKNFRVF